MCVVTILEVLERNVGWMDCTTTFPFFPYVHTCTSIRKGTGVMITYSDYSRAASDCYNTVNHEIYVPIIFRVINFHRNIPLTLIHHKYFHDLR